MKKEKKKSNPEAEAISGTPWWPYALGIAMLVFFVFEIYQPALNGPFVFDDSYLPMLLPNGPAQPFSMWISGVRPLLMASFWANMQLTGVEPYAFKLVNLQIHLCAGALVWLWARKLIKRSFPDFTGDALSAFVAVIFLLHPLQTESVSYVASRSESLSGLLFLGALVTFLYHGEKAVGWLRTVCVLLLFGLAALTKEHTAVLPLLLLLTDYFFNPGFTLEGIKRNWRVYVPVAIGALVGVYGTFRLLRFDDSAGFRMKDFTWYQYLFTQCRSILNYIQLFVFPIGQNIDHNQTISFSLLDHGALLAMALLVVLTIGACIVRKRFPLAAYGFLVFLILLAPTSSVIPIKDTLVERRMYLPLIGLCFVLAQFLPMIRMPRVALVALLTALSAACGFATLARNQLWSSAIALWTDSAAKSPKKGRPAFQVAYAQYQGGNCAEAVKGYAHVAELEKPDYRLYADWALAADCAGNLGEALDKLRLAQKIENSAHVHANIGMMLAKQGKSEEALEELDQAEKLNGRFAIVPFYKGNVFMQLNDYDKAIQAYNRALQLDPKNGAARQSIAMAERQKAQASAIKK